MNGHGYGEILTLATTNASLTRRSNSISNNLINVREISQIIRNCRPHLAELKPFQRMILIADSPQLAWNDRSFKPNFYVDITNYLHLKLEAFTKHESQQRPSPHMGGVDSLRLLAEWRGREISVEAAEAYECMRFVV